MEDEFRELSRAIALGDLTGARIMLDMIARDRPHYSHAIDLGRSDAAVIKARPARPEVVSLKAA